jgi:hypothetical protein
VEPLTALLGIDLFALEKNPAPRFPFPLRKFKGWQNYPI